MLSSAVGCGALLALAIFLFSRERRLWRSRGELEGAVFQYTRRRFVRRSAGCALLALVALLTFLGLEVLDFTGHLAAMQAYWIVIGVFCLGLLVIPILDLRETYRHIVKEDTPERLRREIERHTPGGKR